MAIPIGTWVDRKGGHLLLTIGALIGALAMAALSRIDSLATFYGVWFCIGIAQGAALNNAPYAVLAANHPNYRRAIVHASLLTGLASTAGIPAAGLLVAQFGWRTAALALAAVQLAGPVLIHATVLRGTLAASAQPRLADTSVGRLGTIMRQRAFVGAALAFGSLWFVTTGIAVHGLPMLQEFGLLAPAAVATLALYGPAQVGARVLMFLPRREIASRRLGIMAIVGLAGSLFMLATVSAQTGYILFALLYGASSGLLLIVRQLAIADIFGLRRLGAIGGALVTVTIVPRTMSPLALSWLHDAFGSYRPVVWAMVVLAIIGFAAFVDATRRRPADG